MTKARQDRDWEDTFVVLQYLQERNPFSSDPSLRNIATGVHAHDTVNVDTAESVGEAILQSMDGKTVAECSFKGYNQAITLDTKSSIKIGSDEVQVDPQLLFQRLIAAARTKNCAAAHLLCSTQYCCSENHTSLRWLMPYGNLLRLTSQQRSPLTFNMSWVMVH